MPGHIKQKPLLVYTFVFECTKIVGSYNITPWRSTPRRLLLAKKLNFGTNPYSWPYPTRRVISMGGISSGYICTPIVGAPLSKTLLPSWQRKRRLIHPARSRGHVMKEGIGSKSVGLFPWLQGRWKPRVTQQICYCYTPMCANELV